MLRPVCIPPQAENTINTTFRYFEDSNERIRNDGLSIGSHHCNSGKQGTEVDWAPKFWNLHSWKSPQCQYCQYFLCKLSTSCPCWKATLGYTVCKPGREAHMHIAYALLSFQPFMKRSILLLCWKFKAKNFGWGPWFCGKNEWNCCLSWNVHVFTREVYKRLCMCYYCLQGPRQERVATF